MISFGKLPPVGYVLALPLLGSCGSFGVWGLSAFPGRLGIRVDIGSLLSGGVKSAEVGWLHMSLIIQYML